MGIEHIFLALGSILIVFVNLAWTLRVSDWLFDRFSPELSMIGVLLFCFPSLSIAVWWMR